MDRLKVKWILGDIFEEPRECKIAPFLSLHVQVIGLRDLIPTDTYLDDLTILIKIKLLPATDWPVIHLGDTLDYMDQVSQPSSLIPSVAGK